MNAVSRPPLIELKNVCKTFSDFALENVNLDIKRGEVHVLVGENG